MEVIEIDNNELESTKEETINKLPKEKNKSLKIWFIIIPIIVAIILCVGGFGLITYQNTVNSQKKIDSVKTLIVELSKKETLTQEEVNNLMVKYNDLTDEERSKISEDELNKAVELRPAEKAAISATETIRRTMKSSASFKLLDDVKVRENDKKNGYAYYAEIKYSGQNSFGGTVDNTSFLRITRTYSAITLELAFITGAFEKVLNSTDAFWDYYNCEGKEHTVDAERVMKNIDVPVRTKAN